MPQPLSPTRSELQDRIDRACGVLDEAYAPEASREDLAAAVGQALDVLKGADDEEEDEEDEDVD